MTLERLSEAFWLTICEYNPTIATVRGEHSFDDRLREFSDTWLDSMSSRFGAIASEAAAIDPGPLEIRDRITRDLLIHESQVWATEIDQRFLVAAVDPYTGPHTRILSDTQQNTVTEGDQAERLLSRYYAVGDYLDGALRLIKSNCEQGMTPASAALRRVSSQLDGYLESGLDTDPFLRLQLPHDVDADVWRSRAEDLVREVIRPAVARFRRGLAEHVAPKARPDDKPGLHWMTGGDLIYRGLIEKYTQLGKPPEEIHRIGVEWATQTLQAEWEETGARAFRTKSVDETFERLHNDPSLRFASEEEMLAHARATIDRAWEVVDDWFGTRPESPCRVVPVPASIAPAMPPAYYMQPPPDRSREGTYFLNTYRPQERDRFEYESTHFHEAVPGHHFDRSLASELRGIPLFRRFAQVYAHTEGWGLYAERLADEIGLFSSDVDRLGMLSADAWRAGRLVVDTGLHALGWSREQAIDFLMRWTPIGRLTVEQEVDRYIGMPGQALSYKMGQLEIMRLRGRAETALGSRFSIKEFHDQLLTSGAMTLPLLAEKIEGWIESHRG